MTGKKTEDTTTPKAKPAKKAPAAKAEAVVKPAAKKEAASVASGKTITLTQIGSPIGRQQYQRATLIGLGLNKLQRTRTLADTPAIRGMIAKVKHLIKIVE